jgi:lambda repressor-like predicted transcriptional regulator
MSKRVNKSYIYIDGAKFKNLLETKAGKSLKEISLENGFSDSFLRMVIKTGKASPAAQAVARVYGIEPSAYEDKPIEPETPEGKQISFDDLNSISRDELKELVKGALSEVFSSLRCKTLNVQYDQLGQRYIATLFINKEEIEEA